MEKMLSKSKSRLFGKKKSTKNLGISSSDPPATETERLVNENFAGSSARPTPSTSTPGTVPGSEASVLNGPPSFSRPSHHGCASQSRFEVHISPTAFSPIIIPSSSPPESAAASPSKHRDISTLGEKYGVATMEPITRVGEGLTHGRSQSSVSPNETPNSRARSRRHAIPPNFLESVGATSGGIKSLWNGQNLNSEQYMQSQTPRDRSFSTFPSQTAPVHPSASAPVTSCLSNTDTGLAFSELAPIHESRTEPVLFSSSVNSSGHVPLPRSTPNYNLAGFTPSCVTDSRRVTEVGQRHTYRSHRGVLLQHPVSEASHHPRRASPHPPPPSSSPTRVSEATTTHYQSSNHHRASPSVGSEMETGYKGLTFPLPPSSEEGLTMSFSSSQSSLYSTVSARRSGDQPSTPKKPRDGKVRGDYEHDAKPPGSTESRGAIPGSGRSARDRDASLCMSETRASPTPNVRMTRRKPDGITEVFEHDSFQTNGQSTDGERDSIRRQDRVAKELEDVLGVRPKQDELSHDTHLPRVRAVSEAPRPRPHAAPAAAHLQKPPEPTKPLVLNSSRKALHTTRSFTTLAERKQLQASSSSRDLAGAFNNASSKGERARTVTAIPVRVGPGVQRDRDRDGQALLSAVPIQTQPPEDQSLIPPSFPLPTPPNSSSTLSSLASETKSTEGVPSRPPAGVGTLSASPLTLEEVTEALRVQRVRFDELSGHVLDVAQRHTAEKEAYVGRVGRLEGTVAKLEREIRGLRWLVLENTRVRAGVVSGAGLILETAVAATKQSLESKEPGTENDAVTNERRLRRSSTMPQLPTLVKRPGHARNKRFGGLGLDFSPESIGSSPITLSPLATPSRFEVDMGDGDRTPSMDEIIDKLMAVRQWAGSDVRVSVVESTGEAGESKRIVFREV